MIGWQLLTDFHCELTNYLCFWHWIIHWPGYFDTIDGHPRVGGHQPPGRHWPLLTVKNNRLMELKNNSPGTPHRASNTRAGAPGAWDADYRALTWECGHWHTEDDAMAIYTPRQFERRLETLSFPPNPPNSSSILICDNMNDETLSQVTPCSQWPGCETRPQSTPSVSVLAGKL